MMKQRPKYPVWKRLETKNVLPHSLHALFLALILSTAVLSGCGKTEKEIPKEETGEPNTVPRETQLYREARSTFRSWVQMFQRPRVLDTAYHVLTSASRRRLRRQGVSDPTSFSAWVNQEAARNRTPFSYEFSRFDILDIDVRDSNRAIITATFLVHIRQSSFESVSSFTLLREQNGWKIPFAESSNYESSWWQKEDNFASRIRKEGLRSYRSQAVPVSFSYPQAWDVNESSLLAFAESGEWPGIELEYVDPSTLHAAAVIRLALLPVAELDTLSTTGSAKADSSAAESLQLLERSDVNIELPAAMHGSLARLQDPVSGRMILLLTAVDSSAAGYNRFAETFRILRRSIQLHLDDEIR